MLVPVSFLLVLCKCHGGYFRTRQGSFWSSTESKISGQVYEYCIYSAERKRYSSTVQANHRHYQEISTRKENHTSHNQFKSAKIQTSYEANPENRTKERKIPLQESPTLQVAQLTRYRTKFPSSIDSPTVPLLCCTPIRRDGRCCGGKVREKSKIVTCIEATACQDYATATSSEL